MEETQIYIYYAFGYNYHELRSKNIGRPVHGDFNSLLGMLSAFFDNIKSLDLPVTDNAVLPLKILRDKVSQMPQGSKVDAKLAKEIASAIERIDATLDAELQLRTAFIVTPKRFALNHLLKNPRELLAATTFEKLPNLSQFDFIEACRCIAFSLPTAAAFHLMRATEGVLKFYYCTVVKRNRTKRLMWGDMVDDLRKKRNPPPKSLLDNLDNIRVNFRNPTQHPDARYDIDEAQDLLALSVEVVDRMVRDLSNEND